MVKVMVGLTVFREGDCEQHRHRGEAGAMKRLRRTCERAGSSSGRGRTERGRERAGPLVKESRPAHEREEK
jgi:hypothetical protein